MDGCVHVCECVHTQARTGVPVCVCVFIEYSSPSFSAYD